MHARIVIGLLGACVVAAFAGATPSHAQPADTGYIGVERAQLEIDDCPPNAPGLGEAQLRKIGQERYERGNTLYLQGDYAGAVRELVGSYCATPFFQILKDIGQAYERSLEYEKAIGYLERYVASIKPDSQRLSQCSPDPQVDKQNTLTRIEVLGRLAANIFVETSPPGATVLIRNETRTAASGVAGKPIFALGGTYEMIVELPGRVTQRRNIEVKIGKPYTYYFELKPLEGRLSIQTTPSDARVFVDDRFVGVGRADENLASKQYALLVEAPGHLEQRRTIEVLPNQVNRLQIELAPRPQFGRRQLIVFSAIGGGFATGTLLSAFDDTAIAGLGSVAGVAVGGVGSYLFLPDAVPLGTSNLTITTSISTMLAGLTTSLLFTDDPAIIQPVIGASTLLGAGAGYYLGTRTDVTPGDAALINTTLLWTTAAGALFAVSFDADHRVAAGLTLSGLGVGAISGVLMSRFFDISRTHAALIDVGGIVGMIGGLAAESLAYSADDNTERESEHIANFALGGMAVGLITAGFLTRNLDTPKVSMQPSLGRVTGADGTTTTTYGFQGSW